MSIPHMTVLVVGATGSIGCIVVEEAASACPQDPPHCEWARVKSLLRHQITPEGFNNWLETTREFACEDGVLTVQAPDKETRDWLQTEYDHKIRHALAQLGLEDIRYRLTETSAGAVT